MVKKLIKQQKRKEKLTLLNKKEHKEVGNLRKNYLKIITTGFIKYMIQDYNKVLDFIKYNFSNDHIYYFEYQFKIKLSLVLKNKKYTRGFLKYFFLNDRIANQKCINGKQQKDNKYSYFQGSNQKYMCNKMDKYNCKFQKLLEQEQSELKYFNQNGAMLTQKEKHNYNKILNNNYSNQNILNNQNEIKAVVLLQNQNNKQVSGVKNIGEIREEIQKIDNNNNEQNYINMSQCTNFSSQEYENQGLQSHNQKSNHSILSSHIFNSKNSNKPQCCMDHKLNKYNKYMKNKIPVENSYNNQLNPNQQNCLFQNIEDEEQQGQNFNIFNGKVQCNNQVNQHDDLYFQGKAGIILINYKFQINDSLYCLSYDQQINTFRYSKEQQQNDKKRPYLKSSQQFQYLENQQKSNQDSIYQQNVTEPNSSETLYKLKQENKLQNNLINYKSEGYKINQANGENCMETKQTSIKNSNQQYIHSNYKNLLQQTKSKQQYEHNQQFLSNSEEIEQYSYNKDDQVINKNHIQILSQEQLEKKILRIFLNKFLKRDYFNYFQNSSKVVNKNYIIRFRSMYMEKILNE
ncbi:hypothetical protein PPERSA_07783 [Pseudocohnilembus persalinus]|uniref:Uncharacterized protein n=1 Tax=Pseudocohnilembus persalinus TaxID=266149 RepID=A0A0V0QC25_PSEPJ|nr:hypothetical protein PPERSA_07783 [Pseudocohnilembus persalinus]|eukprot:KRW99706.1 hypothetical protein PPERSA_07783 [Pseudocohnilembus persalinus]